MLSLAVLAFAVVSVERDITAGWHFGTTASSSANLDHHAREAPFTVNELFGWCPRSLLTESGLALFNFEIKRLRHAL